MCIIKKISLYICLIVFCIFTISTHVALAQVQKTDNRDFWTLTLENQKAYLDEISFNTQKLQENMQKQMLKLHGLTAHHINSLRNYFTILSNYTNEPRILEATQRNLLREKITLSQILKPIADNKKNISELLAQIAHFEMHMSTQQTNISKNYMHILRQEKTELESMLDLYLQSTIPLEQLYEKINKNLNIINSDLPHLWQQSYMQTILSYTEIPSWNALKEEIFKSLKDLKLRLHLENPHDRMAWITALSRFFVVIVFGVTTLILAKRSMFLQNNPKISKQILHTMMWFILGLALAAAAFSEHALWRKSLLLADTAYKTILNISMICLILWQLNLAWILRKLSYVEQEDKIPNAPILLRPCCIALVGICLLFPNIPLIILAVLWFTALLTNIIYLHFLPPRQSLNLEQSMLKVEHIMLYVCLLLVLVGLPMHSIIAYICIVALGLSVEWSVACLQYLHFVSEEQKDSESIIQSLMASLLAPVALIFAFFSFYFWAVLIPGGTYFLKSYGSLSIHIDKVHISLWQLILIIGVFYITRAIISMGTRFIENLKQRHEKIDASILPSLQTILNYGAWSVFGIFILHTLGMDLHNVIVVAGGLSVGIGFGMQTIVNNFLSGLILIFSRTLQEGDIVNVGGLDCTVRKISIRATTVETRDSAVIYVPNSEFVSNRLINWTRNSRSVRREISVGVAYGSDTELVSKLLYDIAMKSKDVLKYPAPTVIFNDFGNSTLDFILRFWVHDYNVRSITASALRMDIEKCFREHNIEIAFPQMDLHIKEMPVEKA